MREVIKQNVENIGIDNTNLGISGEEFAETFLTQGRLLNDMEVADSVDAAYTHAKQLREQARASA
jgi:hypothetical protein